MTNKDVPELVRYKEHWDAGCIESPEGEYVRHDQAAAVIAAKDAEIYFDASLGITYKSLCETLNEECGKRFKRAEAAEAKLIEWEKADRLVAKALWEDKVKVLEAKLAQVKDKYEGYAKILRGSCIYPAPVASDADLRAENERLREALKLSLNDVSAHTLVGDRFLIDIVREALNPSEPQT